MRCPTCKKEFYPQPEHNGGYWLYSGRKDLACVFSVQRCPSCQEIIVMREVGVGQREVNGKITIFMSDSEEIIYPPEQGNRKISVAPEIPDEYRDELVEAHAVLEISAKASAALSRRLLQKLLREKLGIRKRDLSQEIDDFISNAQAPSYLTEAIDAVRQIGNFAAHPVKYEHSGEIVDVEQGEAEWLLEVLKTLFDFVFVQPAKLELRKKSLNAKLKELGKPQLKGR